ncbi:ferrous iron transport protein A [Candidatus Micrarchaeota archaeon]|nr:ferrous iron transport protein A [Candidatus Micrarchaeota archaeon]
MEKMSLRALNEKESGRILDISSGRALGKHLAEMGFDPGSIATVINKGSSGLMVIEIKGCCRVAISTEIAEKITVEKILKE